MACYNLKLTLHVPTVLLLVGLLVGASGSLSGSLMKKIVGINTKGPFLGIVVPNAYEMDPLLQSSSFLPNPKLPNYLDILGRRFRFGEVANHTVIVVMMGLAMLNAGITTQLLLSLFNVKGVVHYGIAGNANPNLQIGDVTIPRYWVHSGLWSWQRYGDGSADELPLESSGDYTRDIGYLNVSDYGNGSNLLNNLWYQPEEIFTVDGVPEVRQHAFWIPVDSYYYSLSEKLKGLNLTRCVNTTTCLPRQPTVALVERGTSANIYLDNSAYRAFLYSKFNVTAIDMETAAVALVCHQQKKPFIALRALSDLAGGGSAISNEASIFISLASQNSVNVVISFISLLPSTITE